MGLRRASHRRRREEGLPLLVRKFRDALATVCPQPRAGAIDASCQDAERLGATPVHEFMDLLAL